MTSSFGQAWGRVRRATALFAIVLGGLAAPAKAQPYLLITSNPGWNKTSLDTSPGTFTGTPSVMLMNGADGTPVDPLFISSGVSSYPITLLNPFKAIQVNNEIWVTDPGNTIASAGPVVGPAIHCFTADYDPVLRPKPTYIRSITGGMSNPRGMAVLGSGPTQRVYVCNQNVGAGPDSPGPGINVYRVDGTFDFFIPWPTSSNVGPSDCARLVINGSEKLIATAGTSGNDTILVFNPDGTPDTSNFTSGQFYPGGGLLEDPTGICVAPSGPGGIDEVWVNGFSNSATARTGIFRFSTGGQLLTWYPVNFSLPASLQGVYWLSATRVLYTGPFITSVSSNGAVRAFNPSGPVSIEEQLLSMNGTPTGGTFTLTFNGQTTAPIAFNATPNTVQTALEALSGIGAAFPFIPPNQPPAPNAPWDPSLQSSTRRQSNIQVIPTDDSALSPISTTPFNLRFVQAFNCIPQTLITADSSQLVGGTLSVVRTSAGAGGIVNVYPSASAPANNTFVPLTGTTIPVFNPPTAATWPTSFAGFSPTGNGISPRYISAFTPGPSVPTNPYGAGTAAIPSGQSGILAGTSTVLSVTATPGTTPTSSGMLVTINLSALGGSASQTLTPVTATTFTYTLNVPASQAGGVYNLPLTVTDAQGRTGGGSIRVPIVGLPPANYFAETEPNDTGKAQAQPVTLALASQLPSTPNAFRGVWGVTTGSTLISGGGLTTGDNFRFKTAPRPLGIYRNTLSIESGTAGHAATIRGLNQSGGTIGSADAIVQSSVGSTVRTNSWYGFGRQEELFYRITGGVSTGADYRVTYDSQQVIPELISGVNPSPGNLTIARGASNIQTMAFWLFDSTLTPLAGGGAQGITTQPITRSLAPGGPYYLAIGLSNVATTLAAPADSPARNTPVLDFQNGVVGASSTSFIGVGTLQMSLSDSAGGQWTLTPPLGEMSSHKLYWYQFYVGPQVSPVVTGSASPFPVIASDNPSLLSQGGYSVELTATVTPGDLPPSTGISVVANLSAFGGSTSQAMTDAGGPFTYTLRVPASQSPGDYTIPLTLTDAQGRSATGSLLVRVLAAPPSGAVLEFEPNDTLVGANFVALAPGESIYGYSTEAFADTSAGVANTGDFFIVQAAGTAPGIYRNRLTLGTAGPTGHTGTIRGRQQFFGSVNPFDVSSVFQTSSGAFNQWYSFGRGESIEYRVTGAPTTTGAYVATFSRTSVTPVVVPGLIASGEVSISRGTGNAFTPAMWVYDAALQPVTNFGAQGLTPLTRTFTPGTYYLAMSDTSTANDLATPADSSDLNNIVLGRPDQIACSSAATGDMSVRFSHAAGVTAASGVKAGAFDIVWYQFTVADVVAAGACCLPNGSCVGSVQGACAGTFSGVGTVCSAVNCPVASTAVCCRGVTCAVVASTANCTAPAGVGVRVLPTSVTSCSGQSASNAGCCYADFNKSGVKDVADIFAFLSAWFANSPFSDVGGDGTGTRDVSDIFQFLSAWFAGCT